MSFGGESPASSRLSEICEMQRKILEYMRRNPRLAPDMRAKALSAFELLDSEYESLIERAYERRRKERGIS